MVKPGTITEISKDSKTTAQQTESVKSGSRDWTAVAKGDSPLAGVVSEAFQTTGVSEPKKPSFVRDLLAQPISGFAKLKSFLGIPASMNSLLNLITSKGIKLGLQVSTAQGPVVNRTINLDPKLREMLQKQLFENFMPKDQEEHILKHLLDVASPVELLKEPLTLERAKKILGHHIRGKDQVVLENMNGLMKLVMNGKSAEEFMKTPMTQTRAEALLKRPLTAEEVSILDILAAAHKTEEALQFLLTLPANQIYLSWKNGVAQIGMVLPDGMKLHITLKLPIAGDNGTDPLREFLKSIFKEYYKGFESLLSQEMIFNWNGPTQQFKISFPEQIGLKINEVDHWLVNLVGENTTVVIPTVVSGTLNFAENTLQFDEGTTFKVLKKFPLPDFTVTPQKISYNSQTGKLTIDMKGLPDINIDLKKKETQEEPKAATEEKPKTPSTVEEKPMLDFTFVKATSRYASNTPVRDVPVADGASSTLLARIQKILPIPQALLPWVEIFLGKQNQMTLNLEGKANDVVFSNEVNIPSAGIKGKVSVTIPTNVEAEAAPAEMHPGLESLLVEKLKQIVGKKELQIEDDFMMIGTDTVKDPKKLDNLLDLVRMLPNQNLQIRCLGDQNVELLATLPTGMVVKMELDVIPSTKNALFRSLLPEALISKLDGIESILSKDFTLKWDGRTQDFSIKFTEQQELKLNQIQLKQGGFFKNILVEFVQWILQDRRVVLPQEIKGHVDLKTATVTFEKGTEFKAKLPFGLSITVGLNEVRFDYDPEKPEKKDILLGLDLFGERTIPLDLTKSNVDDLDFEINMYRRRAHYPPR